MTASKKAGPERSAPNIPWRKGGLTADDFVGLYDRLYAAMVRDTEAPIDPLTIWQPDYVDAIACALLSGRGSDWTRLEALLREEQPIHPMLLPALAQAMMARGRPMKSGRKKQLSPVGEREAARNVNYMRQTGSSEDAAVEAVADRLGVSASTVRRAYERHIPKYRRPGWRLVLKTG